MGLFDDFDIDMDEVKAAGGFDFEDGHYDFEISEALTQNGTKNDPDDTKFIIKYDLNDGEAGTYWEWFTIAVDGDPTAKKAKDSLGFLKGRLQDLGFEAAALNDLDPDDLEGIVGTLELRTTSGKGKNSDRTFQNVRNVKVLTDEVDDAEDESEEPVETDAEIKKRVQAKQAERAKATARTAAKTVTKAAPKRTARAAADEAEEENPFE